MKKLFLVLLLSPSLAFASGLSKPVWVGSKAIGMGGAFVGVADDPTAIFHNPAGMTQMKGHNFHLGMDALVTNLDYNPGTGAERAKREFLPVPSFGYVTDVAEPVSLGLGVFFPHGNGGKFATPSAVVTNPNEGRIYSMEIAPAVALQILPTLSVGGAFRVVRISSGLKGQLVGMPGGGFDTVDDLSVSGWGYGGTAGILYKPLSWLSIGGNYRSKIKKRLSGNVAFTAAGSHPAALSGLVLPTLVSGGVSLKPMEELTIGLSYDWERNSEIKTVTAIVPSFGAAGVLPFNYNYKDSHTLHVGGEYWVCPAVAMRFGFAKDFNESIPDAVMNRVVGDIAANELSLGLAYKWNRYSVAGTWNGRFGSRTIQNNGTNVAPGLYQAFIHTVSLGIGISL